MRKQRVVISGIGIISPVGSGTEKFWNALIQGKSGIRPITHFDASQFDSQISGNIIDYNPDDHFTSKQIRHIADFVQYAIVTAREAISMAQLNLEKIDKERMGVLIGSGIGSLETMENEFLRYQEKGPGKISPFFIPKMIINEASGNVSIETGARGPATCVTTACATATNAIGDAMRCIQFGDADIMIAGGTESATTPLGVGGFCALKALSRNNANPQKASRPFDLHRDGFVMGAGAGVVIIESLEHAQKRGAPILAELSGYGRTSDAYHITAPEPSGYGAARAMELAMQDAGLSIKDISYINAHGTSTKLNDKTETIAIKAVFKNLAQKVPVSSTKSMTGHLLGAAGAIEFAACVLAIRDNIIPPTINYETPDPECDLDYVPNVSRALEVKAALSNSLGFGGHNATLLVQKFLQ